MHLTKTAYTSRGVEGVTDSPLGGNSLHDLFKSLSTLRVYLEPRPNPVLPSNPFPRRNPTRFPTGATQERWDPGPLTRLPQFLIRQACPPGSHCLALPLVIFPGESPPKSSVSFVKECLQQFPPSLCMLGNDLSPLPRACIITSL